MQNVGWGLKIESGAGGIMTAVAELSGDLSVANVSQIKKHLEQVLDAECNLELKIHSVSAVDTAFFQLWQSYLNICRDNNLKCNLVEDPSGPVFRTAGLIGLDHLIFTAAGKNQ
ncbi:MAG: STAS domain-containing protein [Candidatus Rifleibacteriota bacterium]